MAQEEKVTYTEEDALEAYENGDEQKAFDIYVELINAMTEDDILEDGNASFELISCFVRFPEFRKYPSEEIGFKTYVDKFFTKEHAEQLARTIEDVITGIYEGLWDAWDMRTHPSHYLPD